MVHGLSKVHSGCPRNGWSPSMQCGHAPSSMMAKADPEPPHDYAACFTGHGLGHRDSIKSGEYQQSLPALGSTHCNPYSFSCILMPVFPRKCTI